MSGPWEDYAQAGQEDGPWSDYAAPAGMRDAPADIQPSGVTPPPNPNFEVQGRSQPAMGAAPSYAPPADPTYQGLNISPMRALLTNEPTSGFAEDMIRGAPSTIGGIVGAAATIPTGPGSIAGAALGGAGGEGVRQSAAQLYSAATGRPMASPGQVLGGMAIQGGLQGGGQALGLGISAAAKGGAKVLSQATRAMTGTPEKSAEYLLKNPGMRALPIEEAGKVYKAGVGDAAEGSMEAGRSVFGKTYPGPEAAVNTFDEMRDVLGAANPNELLGMRQTMMDTLSDTPVTSPKLRMMLAKRIEELDVMLDAKLPDWGGAKQAWREAKIGEDFGSWLPLNKNLSPNVLRTTGALAAAANSASKGEVLGLAALPLISPKVWGAGLRGVGYAAKGANAIPAGVYRVGAQSTAGAAGSALEQAYLQGKR